MSAISASILILLEDVCCTGAISAGFSSAAYCAVYLVVLAAFSAAEALAVAFFLAAADAVAADDVAFFLGGIFK